MVEYDITLEKGDVKMSHLVHKVHKDNNDANITHTAREDAKLNHELLIDVPIPTALACLLPLLGTVHYLIKFS